ncbi:MAG: DUF2304 domain-containing protein [Nitrospirae bacterium]|nr:MAG: DUF2304 domain-containing protein [Nitrospirota bacterium]
MMSPHTLAIVLAVAIMAIVLELIRQRRLRERYALFWLISAVAFLLCAVKFELVVALAQAFGFALPANALFVFGFLFLIGIMLSLTVALSTVAERNERLAQELALIRKRLDEQHSSLSSSS